MVLIGLIAGAGGAAAWQSALAAVGWSEANAESIAKSFFTTSDPGWLPGGGFVESAVRQKWIGRSPAERTQAIRELAVYARRYVQSPAFEKLYAGWIQENYGAVNHGIKLDPDAAPAEDEDLNANQVSKAMSEMLGGLPPEQLRMVLDVDLDALKNNEDDKSKQLLTRLRRIEPLLKSNLPEFRKQYLKLKTLQVTGGNESELDADVAAAAKRDAERKRRAEQASWDKHNLKKELHRRLTEFVAIAGSVDFGAKTQPRAGRQVFANAELEGQSRTWKVLFRLGKEPTMAAVAVAEQWLREL